MIDVDAVRARFPALSSGLVYFDGPGGTQVPREVPEAVRLYLEGTNANHGGAFRTSRESDALVAEARSAFADFLGADHPEEIVFGPNMTTLTFAVSRAIGRELSPGDEIVVTRLDHDANVAPWLAVAEDRGATVRWVDFEPSDATWGMAALERVVTSRTRLVAVAMASNAFGTVNPVRDAATLARRAGALLYVDAVHFAPHGPIDVKDLGCDFLAFSAYKFFGPHLGVLWGRRELLERLRPYKVRPSADVPPDRWETGTQSFEAIAGAGSALQYLGWVGDEFGGDFGHSLGKRYRGRALSLKRAMAAIREYETGLSRALLDGLSSVRGLKLRGLCDPTALDRRVPTFAFTLDAASPRAVCAALDRAGIAAWDGNYYALAAMERLGLEGKGGAVRVGAVHYNTAGEIERLCEELRALSG